MPDALQMLKDDHRKVQEMFKQFEELEDAQQKKRLVNEVIMELEVHTKLEEEIFYPAVADEAEPEGDIMEEAEEEHHVVDLLIAELKRMQPRAKNYDAKFMVLAENVKHHIQEEEQQMLPKAAELGAGRLQELGGEMAERKVELLKSPRSRTGSRSGSRNGATRRTTRSRTTKTTTRPRAGGTRTRTGSARKRTTTTRSTTRTTRSTGGARKRTTTTRTTTRRPSAVRSRAGTRRASTSGRSASTRSRTGRRSAATGRATRSTSTRRAPRRTS